MTNVSPWKWDHSLQQISVTIGFVKNVSIVYLIEQNFQNGCCEVLKKSSLIQHELECDFAFDLCHMEDCSGKDHFRHHKDFRDHLKNAHKTIVLRSKAKIGSSSIQKVELEALDDESEPTEG